MAGLLAEAGAPLKRLLTQNREMRADGVWNWTLPAATVQLTDGSRFNVCPHADACAAVCYARQGTYRFPAVMSAHVANLERTLDDLDRWVGEMTDELRHDRFRPSGAPRADAYPDDGPVDDHVEKWAADGGAAVRIHDAGDFYDDAYLGAWVAVAEATPDVLFYAYTKEVSMVRRQGALPVNLRVLFSLGGSEDHLIDRDVDRHADVFPNDVAMAEAGYRSQGANDLHAVTMQATRVGIVSNRIAKFRKALAGRTFGEVQAERDERRAGREPTTGPGRLW